MWFIGCDSLLDIFSLRIGYVLFTAFICFNWLWCFWILTTQFYSKWILIRAVTTTSQAIAALKMLRENKNKFDLVISDVHMPDMDGFKLLELVGLEMDLPVISEPKTLHMVFSWFCWLKMCYRFYKLSLNFQQTIEKFFSFFRFKICNIVHNFSDFSISLSKPILWVDSIAEYWNCVLLSFVICVNVFD